MSEQDAGSSFPAPFAPTYQIGTLWFRETTNKPFFRRRGEPLPHKGLVLESIPEEYTLEQAQAAVPFPILLPNWVPDGFIFDPSVRVTLPPTVTAQTDPILVPVIRAFCSSVHMLWRHADGRCMGLELAAAPAPPSQRMHSLYKEIDTLQAVRVGAKPAALILRAEGTTPELHVVFPHASMRLLWETNGVLCELSGLCEHVSAQELIQVAESFPSPEA